MNLLLSLSFHLKLCGISLLCLALMHAFLDRRLHWREDMAKVSLVNRQIFYVHTFFLALILTLLGCLSLLDTQALLEHSRLARDLLAGVTLIWSLRLAFQFLVYSPQLWWGKRFETFVHIAFSCLWTYYVVIYGLAWRQQ